MGLSELGDSASIYGHQTTLTGSMMIIHSAFLMYTPISSDFNQTCLRKLAVIYMMIVVKLFTMNIFIKELTSSLMASMGNHGDWGITFEH